MKTFCANFRLAVLLLAASFAPAMYAQNLLQNGTFENGFSAWNGTYGLYNLPLHPAALSGSTVAILDGGEPPMFQSFPTVPGMTYHISYGRRLPELDDNGIPVVGESTFGPGSLHLDLNGQAFDDSVQNRSTWSFYTFGFTATSASSQLSFSVPQYILIGGVFQRSESVFIDNVSAVAVPEPSAFGLLLVGLFFLGRGRQTNGKSWRSSSLYP